MDIENPDENNTLIRKNLKPLLLSNIGFSFEICGQYYIRQVSDGFAIGEDIDTQRTKDLNRESWEVVFEDVDEALDFYLKKRNEFEQGDDYGLYRLWQNGEL